MKHDDDNKGGVAAVERALDVLDCFQVSHPALKLSELSLRTGLHKTTALRLVRTLESAGYVVRRPDGRWRLGPSVARLGARYTATFDSELTLLPPLQELSRTSGESASVFVREGDIRICIARVEGPSPIRHAQRVGRALPLHLGAPGKVLLAFSGERGEVFDEIRAAGFCISIGER
ncbi:MAG: IclR family transcriptional regulator, partial [Shinella sp.]